jgi:pyridoxine/pyridoxamine 5'-phosphate oxidase
VTVLNVFDMSLRSAFDSILNSRQPLRELDGWLWQTLAAGASSKRHAWNHGGFSTVEVNRSGVLSPKTRTVILRRVDPESRSLDLYTDVRASKVHQLQPSERSSGVAAEGVGGASRRGANACWLFYRHSTRIQVRIEGNATVLGFDEEQAAWDATPLRSRSVYASIEPPGLVLPSTQPPETSDRELSEMESQRGRENFRVVRTTAILADILYLRREGHVRARIEYGTDGHQAAVAHWVAP